MDSRRPSAVEKYSWVWLRFDLYSGLWGNNKNKKWRNVQQPSKYCQYTNEKLQVLCSFHFHLSSVYKLFILTHTKTYYSSCFRYPVGKRNKWVFVQKTDRLISRCSKLCTAIPSQAMYNGSWTLHLGFLQKDRSMVSLSMCGIRFIFELIAIDNTMCYYSVQLTFALDKTSTPLK